MVAFVMGVIVLTVIGVLALVAWGGIKGLLGI